MTLDSVSAEKQNEKQNIADTSYTQA